MTHLKSRSDAITIGPVILSYPHLFETTRFNNDPAADAKYSTAVILTGAQASEVGHVCRELASRAFSNEYEQSGFLWPFAQVGSQGGKIRPDLEESFPGHWIINAKAPERYPPQVVGHDRKPLTDRSQVFAGAKAYVVLSFFSFATGRNDGIGAGLSAVMVWGEGEHIAEGGQVSAATAFEGIQVTPMGGTQGMPQQGMPQQAMPQQAMPQQAMPQQAMPQQAMPQQGMPQQGMPQQGMPQQGMPQQGMPQQGMPQQGMPQQGMPQQGMPQQGMPQQGMPQQGMPNGVPPINFDQ